MLYISREDVLKILTYKDCVDWVEEGMLAEGHGEATGLPRFRLQTTTTGDTGLLAGAIAVMSGTAPVKGFASIRTFGGTPFRAGIILFDSTGNPAALMDFAHLQIYRTGAAAAIGGKYLSRPDSHRLAVVGSGRMARAAVAAHAVVRQITDARVYSRTPANREAFAREMGEELGINFEPAESEAEAVKDADIIVSCAGVQTLEQPPAFHGALMQPGQYVVALGGPGDNDQDTFRRASRVVVDDKPEVKAELKDIIYAVESGLFTWDELDDLPQIVAGERPGRQSDDEIIVMRARGSAVQDIFPAVNLYLKAKEQGIGTDLGDVYPARIGF